MYSAASVNQEFLWVQLSMVYVKINLVQVMSLWLGDKNVNDHDIFSIKALSRCSVIILFILSQSLD